MYAVANHYHGFMEAVCRKLEGNPEAAAQADYPKVEEGAEGVKFVHAAVKSSDYDSIWVDIK